MKVNVIVVIIIDVNVTQRSSVGLEEPPSHIKVHYFVNKVPLQ